MYDILLCMYHTSEKMEEEYYIKYDLCFRNPIKIDKDTIFKNFNTDFVEEVIIKKIEDEENLATIQLNLKKASILGKREEEIKNASEEFLMEFLYKLSLKLRRGLFPFYKLKEYKLENNKLNIQDYMEQIEKITFFDNLSNELDDEEINFKKNNFEYKKIIRILSIADTDPVTVFLVLYDWFLELVTPEEKTKKQKYVVDYIRDYKEELEKPQYDGYLEYIFKNTVRNIGNRTIENEEDPFTKLRNDIGHSYERNGEYSIFFNECKNAIKPMVYIMTHYLKNN